MAKKMGKYCKAYPITKFREYRNWTEKLENARKEKKIIDGKEEEVGRKLSNKSHLYLQENYFVTDGIYLDENIIFDGVTPGWKKYCNNELDFKIPVYEPVAKNENESKDIKDDDQ